MQYHYVESPWCELTVLRCHDGRRCPKFSTRALSYYSGLTLSQEFQPMAAQLSVEAALPLAKILATASCRNGKTGPRPSITTVQIEFERNVTRPMLHNTQNYTRLSKEREKLAPPGFFVIGRIFLLRLQSVMPSLVPFAPLSVCQLLHVHARIIPQIKPVVMTDGVQDLCLLIRQVPGLTELIWRICTA